MYHCSYNDCWILTNTKLCCIGNLASSIVADNTAVAPFIALLHTGDGQCNTVRPLCTTLLPRLALILLLSWLPLPVVVKGSCPSGFSSECHRFA